MNQYLPDAEAPQVLYQGRWVLRNKFRAFVYNATEKKLANSYEEYSQLIESGLWFSSKEDIEPKQPINIRSGKKAKNGANS
jgi:hypothetical protein